MVKVTLSLNRYAAHWNLYGNLKLIHLIEHALNGLDDRMSWARQFQKVPGVLLQFTQTLLKNDVLSRTNEKNGLNLSWSRKNESKNSKIRWGLKLSTHVDIGISIIDADLKIVHNNSDVNEMYGFPDSLTQSGQPFELILLSSWQNGESMAKVILKK